jgi:hypothetical protein
MLLSMAVRLGWSPPCGNRNGAKLGEQVTESEHLIAMGARSSGSESSRKNAAFLAALLTEQSQRTFSTVLGVRRQPFCVYDSRRNACPFSPVLHTVDHVEVFEEVED